MKSGPTISYELRYWQHGHLVAGIDEVGRGALAGPVVAAAVILAPDDIPTGLDDSKKLTAGQRALLAERIRKAALAIGISVVDALYIDEHNILQSTFHAMHKAVSALDVQPQHLLVDGNRFRQHAIASTCIVKGDAASVSIAAASIIAKEFRDALMKGRIHSMYPLYGFNRHVGYGTQLHRAMLVAHGPCPEHRRTFLTRILAP